MANRRDIEIREHAVRRGWMEKLSTEALIEGLKERRFRGGGNTVAKEILRERGIIVEG